MNEKQRGEFEILYSQCHKKLFATALQMTSKYYVAEDILQETVVSAYENFEKLRNKQYFVTWITRILINHCKKYYKNSRKYETCQLEAITEIVAEDRKTDIDIDYILGKLDIKHREVVCLKYFGELSLEEISKVLNVPLGTVKSRLSRAMDKLRIICEKEDI